MIKFINNILFFVLLVVLQTFVVTHLAFWQYMSIYVFIMVVIMADMNTKKWLMLLIGFVTGAVIDLIEGGSGVFAACTTWIAFVRPQILFWTAGRESTTSGGMPTSSKIGGKRFFTYVSIMVLLWNIPFFSLEAAGSFSWIYTTLRIVISSAASVIVIFFLQLPFNRSKYDV